MSQKKKYWTKETALKELHKHGYNISYAASSLGLSRQWLYEIVKREKIDLNKMREDYYGSNIG